MRRTREKCLQILKMCPSCGRERPCAIRVRLGTEYDSWYCSGYGRRNTSNGSDGASLLSAQLGISVSQASVNSSLQAAASERTRARLSPVVEASKTSHKDQPTSGLQPVQQQPANPRRPSRTHTKGGSGDLVAVPGAATGSASNTAIAAVTTGPDSNMRPGSELPFRKASSSRSKTATLNSKPSIAAFRRKPLPVRAQSSALTARLAAKSSGTTNPFHYLYAGISGREDSHYTLHVYFPHSITHKHTPREIRVRKDVSVEEVIGHALWVYWEDKAEPPLDDPIPPDMDKKVRLSSAGWCLRIVEEDTGGEVDEDYPGAHTIRGRLRECANRSSSNRTWRANIQLAQARAGRLRSV